MRIEDELTLEAMLSAYPDGWLLIEYNGRKFTLRHVACINLNTSFKGGFADYIFSKDYSVWVGPDPGPPNDRHCCGCDICGKH